MNPSIAQKKNTASAVADSIVEFDHVGLRYHSDRDILSDISFHLQSGRFYFVTGHSGAGKTSLLKILYLAQRPTRGFVRLFGEDVLSLPRHRLPGLRRRIGVVFQDFRLIPHLSARDNIALPLRVAGVEEKEMTELISQLLDWIGLAEHGNSLPATLSGGEQQRIAIARAVVAQPKLLIADEPTGNVDPSMAKKIILLFETLNRRGTTVVVATHDLQLIDRLPHAHVLRLERGKLLKPAESHPHLFQA